MDKELLNILEQEEKRQNSTLNLIASENYPSREVNLALTSIASAKYAEGYSGKRYYGGCKTIDELENLAVGLAKDLFKVKYVNVQPHSGSNANLAVYFALLNKGDKVLAPAMDSGGHLTHGSAASITSQLWDFSFYHAAGPSKEYDMDKIAAQAAELKPKLIIAGTSAYAKLIDWQAFSDIAKSVDALLMADIAHLAGLIAAGVIPSPVELADIITSTTQKTLRGPRGGLIMTNNAEIAKSIDRAIFPGLQGGPHEHIIAAKAQCFVEALGDEFKNYATQILKNANTLNETLLKLNCKMWTDHTETHLCNIDTKHSFGIGGAEAEKILEAQGIIVNREALPGDDKPLSPSGIRLGTPALTTRGMREAQMIKIAELIVGVLCDKKSVEAEVKNLTRLFPL